VLRILLISDAHANIEALNAVLNHTDFDEAVFMGDAVDYGPNPVEVFDLLGHIEAKRVLGNHDAAAAFKIDCRSSRATYTTSVTTRRWITWKLMSQTSLDLLGKAEPKLELEYDGLRVRALHGAPGDPLNKYITKDEAGTLEMRDADLMILGHTHIAYEVKKDGVWVVNPGSVGFPSDNDPRASCAILETNSRQVTFRRAKYDIEQVVSKLRALLPIDREDLELLSQWLRTAQR
jgi:putative phosphoesterase